VDQQTIPGERQPQRISWGSLTQSFSNYSGNGKGGFPLAGVKKDKGKTRSEVPHESEQQAVSLRIVWEVSEDENHPFCEPLFAREGFSDKGAKNAHGTPSHFKKAYNLKAGKLAIGKKPRTRTLKKKFC